MPEIGRKFMFPCKMLFEGLRLRWDGRNGFTSEGETVVYLSEGNNSALCIKKTVLMEYFRGGVSSAIATIWMRKINWYRIMRCIRW